MNNQSFEEIKIEVEKLAERIQAPKSRLPMYGFSLDERPCVDLNSNGQLSLVYSDRGKIAKSELALDIDHLLYLIFRDLTYFMAIEFNYENPDKEIDIRRLQNKKQLELLGKLKEKWKDMEQENQAHTLKLFPFNDYEGKRQTYLRELLANGFLYKEALEKSFKRYP